MKKGRVHEYFMTIKAVAADSRIRTIAGPVA
jgi:hypothetical protein